MNSMLYQKQFQPSSVGMRMTQHFPGQFNPQVDTSRHAPCCAALSMTVTGTTCLTAPGSLLLLLPPTQMLSQPNMVSPLVRPPHGASFAGGVQRSAMGQPMSAGLGGGLMPHPRPQHPLHSQHPPRGPPGPSLVPRGAHHSGMNAEQDLKVCSPTFLFGFICFVFVLWLYC